VCLRIRVGGSAGWKAGGGSCVPEGKEGGKERGSKGSGNRGKDGGRGGEGRVYKEPLKLYGGTLPEPEVSFFTVQAPTLYVAEMYGA
jgi:hypothetical protein